MPKGIVCIKECGVSAQRQLTLGFDFSSNYIDPHTVDPNVPGSGTPLSLGDQVMTVTVTNSIAQINNAIRSAAITNLAAQGFPDTLMTAADIIIFGGAL